MNSLGDAIARAKLKTCRGDYVGDTRRKHHTIKSGDMESHQIVGDKDLTGVPEKGVQTGHAATEEVKKGASLNRDRSRRKLQYGFATHTGPSNPAMGKAV